MRFGICWNLSNPKWFKTGEFGLLSYELDCENYHNIRNMMNVVKYYYLILGDDNLKIQEHDMFHGAALTQVTPISEFL